MVGKTTPVYTITIAAGLVKVHPRTLRLYEKEGFIKPYRNPQNNHRLYSNADIGRLKTIRFLLHEDRLNVTGLKSLVRAGSLPEDQELLEIIGEVSFVREAPECLLGNLP